jgi:hypothetical protein
MPGFRSLMSSMPSAKVAVLNSGARVAAGLFQFGDECRLTVGRPKRSSTKALRIQLP